eukprot:6647658-Lingulodinium_polyedra.AAC.1
MGGAVAVQDQAPGYRPRDFAFAALEQAWGCGSELEARGACPDEAIPCLEALGLTEGFPEVPSAIWQSGWHQRVSRRWRRSEPQ